MVTMNFKKNLLFAGLPGMLAFVLTACEKDERTAADGFTVTDGTIAVAATISTSATSGSTDSVYVLHQCGRGASMAATSLASIPAAIGTYLTANYEGYTLLKALSANDASGNVTAYIVVIYYNDKPVALKFDVNGNFVQVLEQRERDDLGGRGWHHGGRFQHRNGRGKDSVAISAIPAHVLSSFTSAYNADTLVKAYRTSDSGYVLLSRNNGLFATAYTAAGVYVNRTTLTREKGQVAQVEASALPAAVASYLTTTYPGYVFNKAFSLTVSGAVKGYVVVIDANNTRYGLSFDAGGNFLAMKTIH